MNIKSLTELRSVDRTSSKTGPRSIASLVPDIYSFIQNTPDWKTQLVVQPQFTINQNSGRLRLSGLGPRCPRALWYSVHKPELAEPLPPWAEIKYTYGHMVESLALELCRLSGHTVTGEQDEVVLDGIVGHRDAVVDGAVLDVKSISTMGFNKYKSGQIAQQDDFGYLYQLDAYTVASYNDPLVTIKDKAYNLIVDKTLGHMYLYEHTIRPQTIALRVEECKRISGLTHPPDCTCKSIPDGSSGNLKLDVKASYSPYKFCCNPHIRVFLYSDGPRYLTKVVRVPDVKEILTKHLH